MPPLCVCASVDHAVYGVRRLVRGAADHAGSVVRGAGHRAPPIRLGRAAASGDSRRGRAGKSCDDTHGKQFSVHLIRPPFLAICRKFARKSAEICGKPLEKLAFEQVLTHEQNFIEKKYHPVHSDGKFGEESGLQKFKEGI